MCWCRVPWWGGHNRDRWRRGTVWGQARKHVARTVGVSGAGAVPDKTAGTTGDSGDSRRTVRFILSPVVRGDAGTSGKIVTLYPAK